MATIKYNLGSVANNNYSIDEQVVGTWIDGKPIYRKVIYFGSLPNKATKSVAHNITNLDVIVDFYGLTCDSTNVYIPLPATNNISNAYTTYILIDATNISIRNGADMSDYVRTYITLEYTKTTDAATS